MLHKTKGPGQPSQWIRVCASCEWVYLGGQQKFCPKCKFAHYGAPFVYSSWLKSLWYLITQKPYRDRKNAN
jgi:hypothetical protein